MRLVLTVEMFAIRYPRGSLARAAVFDYCFDGVERR